LVRASAFEDLDRARGARSRRLALARVSVQERELQIQRAVG
jgi:hypothetical protein